MIFSKKLGGGGGGEEFTARQDYFTHFESVNRKVGRKREIPEKKYLTTCKQNLACATCEPSYARTHSEEMTSDLEC